MSIVENEKRVGRFTSSEVHNLIKRGTRPMTPQELIKHKEENPKSQKRNIEDGFGAAGLTYIRKKYYERKLKRSLDLGKYSQPAHWGLFLEQYVYSHFTGLDYIIMSNETKVNPKIPYHAGSTDLLVPGEKVSDIKCLEPYAFCEIIECFNLCRSQNSIDPFKENFPDKYWQLVSNSMIHDVPKAESIIYMPSLEDLEDIKQLACDYDGDDQWKYRFIYESDIYQLPYVPDGSEYESLNRFEFIVPEDDIRELTSRLELADLEIEKMMGNREAK